MENYNGRKVPLKVNRHEVCDILRATTHLFSEFDSESKDPTVSEERRKIAAGSAKYWLDFHDKIKAQLDAFDAINFSDQTN